MVWQDIVISMANVVFGYSLAYQALRGFKEKKGFLTIQTSLLTAIGLYSVALAFFTLGLFISAITSSFNGTMWLILFIQRLVYKKA